MTVCKQNHAVSHKFRHVNISLISFCQILKNFHTLDILLSDVIFFPLSCGLFFPRYSLSSADKTKRAKCQTYVKQTPL